MNENVLIICESMYHGNTHKLGTAMARKLNCRLMTCEQAVSENLQKYKVIGLGSGIYFTSHHPKLFDIVSKMEIHKNHLYLHPSQAIAIQHSWKEAIVIAKRHAKKTSLYY